MSESDLKHPGEMTAREAAEKMFPIVPTVPPARPDGVGAAEWDCLLGVMHELRRGLFSRRMAASAVDHLVARAALYREAVELLREMQSGGAKDDTPEMWGRVDALLARIDGKVE